MNFSRAILILGLAGCVALVATIPPLKFPIIEQPTISDLLVKGPLCFTWSEVTGDSAMDHSGGVVFLWKDHKIYSRAWYSHAKYAREWPPVFGVGSGDGNMLHVAYRSASQDPKHEFYHTVCHFEFLPDAQTFYCHFMQQVTAYSTEMTPGAARGVRCEMSEEFAVNLQRIKSRLAFVEHYDPLEDTAEHCPVITENRAEMQNEVLYEGKLYHFCCLSCRDVFLKNPRVFVSK